MGRTSKAFGRILRSKCTVRDAKDSLNNLDFSLDGNFSELKEERETVALRRLDDSAMTNTTQTEQHRQEPRKTRNIQ